MVNSKKMSLPTLKQHVGFTQAVASSVIPIIKVSKIGARAVGGIVKEGANHVSKLYR
jgi:hypothetical protein